MKEELLQQMYREIKSIIGRTGERKVLCVVPTSGGKDSQACLEWACNHFGADNVVSMFCDTNYEHSLTYEHVNTLSDMYGARVVKFSAGNVIDRVLRYGRFPSGKARFCTDELKIKVGKAFYSMLAEQQNQGFEVWYGMRLGESYDRSQRYKNHNETSLYEPHEIMATKYPKYLGAKGIKFRLPILTWEEEDVFEFLRGKHNPLYDAGFDRVGCFPCLASGDAYKEKAFAFDAEGKQRRIEVLQIAKRINKNVFTSKGGRVRNPEFATLDADLVPPADELAPCFHCNI